MSISVDRNTVVKGLWSSQTPGQVVRPNGRFLHIHMDGSSSAGSSAFTVTCMAFHGTDETQAVVGTSTGLLFGLSLRENKLFLLADLGTRTRVRCVAFCGPSAGQGNSFDPHVVAVTEGNVLSFVDWRTSALLHQANASGAHARPMTLVATALDGGATSRAAGEPHSQVVVCLSPDTVSCWVPRDMLSMRAQGAATTKGARYMCVATAEPAQCMDAVRRQNRSPTRPRETKEADATSRGTSEQHRFVSASVHRSFIYITETNGVLGKWAIPQENFEMTRAPSSLTLTHCVQTLPFRASCSAACSAFLALGCRDLAAVALVNPDTMEGMGVFQVHGASPSDVGARGAPPLSVKRVSIVGNELVFCALSDGQVVAVAASSHQCVFAIQPPRSDIHTRFCAPLNWDFVVSGPSYGCFLTSSDCVVIHLPTAKAYHDQCQDMRRRYGNEADSPASPQEAGNGGGQENDEILSFTVQVIPFLTQRRENSGPGKVDNQRVGSAGGKVPPHRASGAASPGSAALSRCHSSIQSQEEQKRRFPREPLKFAPGTFNSAENPRERWIDVNAAEAAASNGAGSNSPRQISKEDARGMSVLVRALYCDNLNDVACAFNMKKLREYLNRYGVFPAKFRPAIWRFVLGLPQKRRTAPQFAALARKLPHPCVTEHMEPFPLPKSPARSAIEQCISAMAHHSPSFAIASFMPTFVFPFLHVFGDDDVQSILEVLLVFFRNWGREYFVCYPEPPSGLMTFMNRRLAQQDAKLAEHLTQMGCGPEVWCWQPMLSLYTDILTGPEWLQVMDHAFMQTPMWLYCFHIAMIQSHRSTFLHKAASLEEVTDVLSRPFSDQQPAKALPLVGEVIEKAYALLEKCPRDVPFVKNYFDFVSLSTGYTYPDDYPMDPEVLGVRMEELRNLEEKRTEEREAARELAERERRDEVEALQMEVALQQQRARITAKYESSNETWRSRVALEGARQRMEAKERALRLAALQQRITSAEELERIRQEVDAVDAQGRNDVVDQLVEQHKWNIAAGLTDAELKMLERDAAARVAAGLERLVGRRDEQDDAERYAGEGDASAQPGAKDIGTGRQIATLPQTSALVDAAGSSKTSKQSQASPSGKERGTQADAHATVGLSGCAGNGTPRTVSLPDVELTVIAGRQAEVENDCVDSARVHSRPTDQIPSAVEASRDEGAPPEEERRSSRKGTTSSPPTPGDDVYPDRELVHTNQSDDDFARSNEELGGQEGHVAPYSHHHASHGPTAQEEKEAPVPPYNYESVSEPLNDADRDHRQAEEAPYNERDNLCDEENDHYGEEEITAPRAVPLPRHMAPFVPSAELLKSLQTYQTRRNRVVEAASSQPPVPGACTYPYDRFEPETRPVVPPYQEKFDQLQAEVERLREQARRAGSRSSTSSYSDPRTPGGGDIRTRLTHLSQRNRPLFDNLSDDPTPTTTTVTGATTTTSATRSSEMRTQETETAASTYDTQSSVTDQDYYGGGQQQRGEPGDNARRSTPSTALLSGSTEDSGAIADQYTGNATSRDRNVVGRRPAASMGSTETPSSSAASAIRRPWKDDYYWRQ